MGSFLAFAMMGLFPNPGQDVYLITPPYFPSLTITHPLTNLTSHIRTINFDPTYKTNLAIQHATLDGRPYTRSWLDHSFFTQGRELVLTLGRNESVWGTRVEDRPPSVGRYRGFDDLVPPGAGGNGSAASSVLRGRWEGWRRRGGMGV